MRWVAGIVPGGRGGEEGAKEEEEARRRAVFGVQIRRGMEDAEEEEKEEMDNGDESWRQLIGRSVCLEIEKREVKTRLRGGGGQGGEGNRRALR